MGTTSDGGETIQLASESHLAPSGEERGEDGWIRRLQFNQQTWKNIRIN